MGLLIECPVCRKRIGIKKESVLVGKTSGRTQESVIGSNTILMEAGSENVSDSASWQQRIDSERFKQPRMKRKI